MLKIFEAKLQREMTLKGSLSIKRNTGFKMELCTKDSGKTI